MSSKLVNVSAAKDFMRKVNRKKVGNRQMSKHLMKRFIETYKANSSLWKTNSNNYRSRMLKEKSYLELIKLVSPEIPNADKKFIAKKIHTIRVCFRKEYRKWLENKSYKPSLWYYNLLSFIVDDNFDENSICANSNLIEKSKISRDFEVSINESTESENTALEDAMCIENSNKNYIKAVKCSPFSSERRDIYKDTDTIKVENLNKKRKNEKSLHSEFKYHIRISPVQFPKIVQLSFDEFDTFGHFISKKLKKIALENQKQYVFCKNIIKQAMMKAHLGKLTENSYILS